MSQKDTNIQVIPGKEQKTLLDVLNNDFERFHQDDGSYGGYNKKSSNYAINLPHPIKNAALYGANATTLLRDDRSHEEREIKRHNISIFIQDIEARDLSKAIAKLARSGGAASDLKTIIEQKGIQNINFNASVPLPYIESYQYAVQCSPPCIIYQAYENDVYWHQTYYYETRYRIKNHSFSIMEIAAKENNTVFIDTIMAEYLKAVYNNTLNAQEKDQIENSLYQFFNHSSNHRQVIGNTLYGAIERVKQDLANQYDFNPDNFNRISKNITRRITGKLHAHVAENRLHQKTAWILSFTVCLLLPIISHAVVWGIYFYQQSKMDFKNTTITWDQYLDYLNRKDGRDYSTFAEVQQHLDAKEAAKPTAMNEHKCSKSKAPCYKPTHQFTIPKQVEFSDVENGMPQKVNIRTTTWNGQTQKFRRTIRGLEQKDADNEMDESQHNNPVQPSAPSYAEFFNAPPLNDYANDPYNNGDVTYPNPFDARPE